MADDGSTPVRRTGRARKLNSKFANDEIDDSFRKIAERINAPDTSIISPNNPRQKEKVRKDLYGTPIVKVISPPDKPKIVSVRVLHVPKSNEIKRDLAITPTTVTKEKSKKSKKKKKDKRELDDDKKHAPYLSVVLEDINQLTKSKEMKFTNTDTYNVSDLNLNVTNDNTVSIEQNDTSIERNHSKSEKEKLQLPKNEIINKHKTEKSGVEKPHLTLPFDISKEKLKTKNINIDGNECTVLVQEDFSEDFVTEEPKMPLPPTNGKQISVNKSEKISVEETKSEKDSSPNKYDLGLTATISDHNEVKLETDICVKPDANETDKDSSKNKTKDSKYKAPESNTTPEKSKIKNEKEQNTKDIKKERSTSSFSDYSPSKGSPQKHKDSKDYSKRIKDDKPEKSKIKLEENKQTEFKKEKSSPKDSQTKTGSSSKHRNKYDTKSETSPKKSTLKYEDDEKVNSDRKEKHSDKTYKSSQPSKSKFEEEMGKQKDKTKSSPDKFSIKGERESKIYDSMKKELHILKDTHVESKEIDAKHSIKVESKNKEPSQSSTSKNKDKYSSPKSNKHLDSKEHSNKTSINRNHESNSSNRNKDVSNNLPTPSKDKEMIKKDSKDKSLKHQSPISKTPKKEIDLFNLIIDEKKVPDIFEEVSKTSNHSQISSDVSEEGENKSLKLHKTEQSIKAETPHKSKSFDDKSEHRSRRDSKGSSKHRSSKRDRDESHDSVDKHHDKKKRSKESNDKSSRISNIKLESSEKSKIKIDNERPNLPSVSPKKEEKSSNYLPKELDKCSNKIKNEMDVEVVSSTIGTNKVKVNNEDKPNKNQRSKKEIKNELDLEIVSDSVSSNSRIESNDGLENQTKLKIENKPDIEIVSSTIEPNNSEQNIKSEIDLNSVTSENLSSYMINVKEPSPENITSYIMSNTLKSDDTSMTASPELETVSDNNAIAELDLLDSILGGKPIKSPPVSIQEESSVSEPTTLPEVSEKSNSKESNDKSLASSIIEMAMLGFDLPNSKSESECTNNIVSEEPEIKNKFVIPGLDIASETTSIISKEKIDDNKMKDIVSNILKTAQDTSYPSALTSEEIILSQILNKNDDTVSEPLVPSVDKQYTTSTANIEPIAETREFPCIPSPLQSPLEDKENMIMDINIQPPEPTVPKIPMRPITPPEPVVKTPEELLREAELKEKHNREVVKQRLKAFEHLTENLYIMDRKKTRACKEVRRMVCDCYLTAEEIENHEKGCGEDCLNRLLMIECGSRCNLKENCLNKRFQKLEYADIEVFNADEKGCGVRAKTDIDVGTFIMEYVGEVYDSREFRKRKKIYARDSTAHFYFMAVRADQLIDATRKGNISRFINHSCDPNAETQKWTVNGEIKIGFFATKPIRKGEEINFDYRLERYGREPQKCYCGTPLCRGWLGEAPDQKTKEEKDQERRDEKERRRKKDKKAYMEDMDLDNEIEKLMSRGIRNRQDTLNLSRLMVRAEAYGTRASLLNLLYAADPACLRLFLDYHGLKLLWSWMADLTMSFEHTQLKLEVLKILEFLPIVNRTQVSDSRVLSVVEKWSRQVPEDLPKLSSKQQSIDKKSRNGEDSDNEGDSTQTPVSGDSNSPDDSSLDSNETNKPGMPLKISLTKDDEDSSDSNQEMILKDKSKTSTERHSESELIELHKTMVALALKLLDLWRNLKEAFRIPKNKRVEIMKEHEREVDQGYKDLLDRGELFEKKDRYSRSYYDNRKRISPDRDRERNRWYRKMEQEKDPEFLNLSKEERRQRFEQKVAEDEAAKQKKMQEQMWNMHVDRCHATGRDPYLTPIFDPTGQYYWEPTTSTWNLYTGPDPNIPVPASYGNANQNIQGNNMNTDMTDHSIPGGLLSNVAAESGHIAMYSSQMAGDINSSPSVTIMGNNGSSVQVPVPDAMVPPEAVTIRLPSKWRVARTADGILYFYHTRARVSQWEPPTMEQHKKIENLCNSESDSDGDSDSTTTSDSEDFSSDEEQQPKPEEEKPVIERVEEEKMIRRPKGKRKHSDKLVQQRVISPILEIDRETARKERKEAKVKAKEEARQERRSSKRPFSMLSGLFSEFDDDADVDDDNMDQAEENEVNLKNLSYGELAIKYQMRKRQFMEEEDDDQSFSQSKYRAVDYKKLTKKVKSKERALTAIADNSETARKIKDNFRSKMATYIVTVLNPYRRSDCTSGKITSTEDFKYLARKLTHFVMVKELKQLSSIDELTCSER